MADSIDANSKVVVIAVDESEHAEHAFEYFMDNIYKPTDNIILVHSPEYHEAVYGLTTLNDHMKIGAETKRIKQVLERFAGGLRAKGVGGRVKSVAGKPGEAVIQLAIEENAYLIVTGSRGLSAFRRTVLGSVGGYITQHACCPVLICGDKNGDKDRRKNHWILWGKT